METVKTTKTDLWNINPSLINVVAGFNTREDFDLESLKNSIRENGIKQAITVWKQKGEEVFYLVDGERRLRAVRALISEGVEIMRVPSRVIEKPNDEEANLNLIIRNDGKPLTPTELAHTYKRLINFGWTATEVAKRTGKTLSHVSQTLDILDLPAEVQAEVKAGNISATKAKKIKKATKDDASLTKAVKQAGKKAKVEEIDPALMAEDHKKKESYKVHSCRNCPLTVQVKFNPKTGNVSDLCCLLDGANDVTDHSVLETRPENCPLTHKIINIKLG